jgi:hypothetical protein
MAILSEICINKKGEICEVVDFELYKVEYLITGVKEHKIFGIYFVFTRRIEY